MFKTTAKIVKKDRLQEDTYSFILNCDLVAKEAKPGQFVNIFVEGFTLRRPISICEIFEDSFRIVFAVRGKGTAKMAEWDVGKNVDVVGPLGKGFQKVDRDDKLLIVGGGIGTPPLLELAKRARFVRSIIGFKTKSAVILHQDFAKAGETIVCTDDGTYAQKGLVTKFLLKSIQSGDFTRIAACGPKAMLREIANIAKNFKIFCEISLEERMACGVGACLGCQCVVYKEGKKQSAHICKDGPVFNANEVLI